MLTNTKFSQKNIVRGCFCNKITQTSDNMPWLLHPPGRGSHVKWDNTHTFIQHTTLSPYTSPEPWFSAVVDFLKFTPTASCNGIPQPQEHRHHVTMHHSTGGRSERTPGQAKNYRVKFNQYTYAPWLFNLSNLPRIVAQPPPLFLCCQRQKRNVQHNYVQYNYFQ